MSENILDIQLTNKNVFLMVLQCLTLGTLLIEHPVGQFWNDVICEQPLNESEIGTRNSVRDSCWW